MLLILIPTITDRLDYIIHVMIGKLLQVAYRLTTDIEEYQQWEGAKFAYAQDRVGGVQFGAVDLLFESDIRCQELTSVEWEGLKLFFPVQNEHLPFDPFALSFYLISRYEEYLADAPKDQHGRFDISGSVAWQKGFHRKPVVNMIANRIGEIIHREYPDLVCNQLPFRLIRTYDVDIAYQYKGKTAVRFIGSLLKSIVRLDVDKTKKLLMILFGQKVQDEFDTFKQHQQIAEQESCRPIHFILTAPLGKYDRNINPKGKSFAKLVRKLSTFSEIGIHPSYYSSEKTTLIGKEKRRLEMVLGSPVTKSRQHFLKFTLPETYLALIECGIEDDYSLGWPNEVGFRASIAASFPFFDLIKNQQTKLQLHPLSVMDGALAQIVSSEEEYMEIMRTLMDEVRRSGGEFIILNHNSFDKM